MANKKKRGEIGKKKEERKKNRGSGSKGCIGWGQWGRPVLRASSHHFPVLTAFCTS